MSETTTVPVPGREDSRPADVPGRTGLDAMEGIPATDECLFRAGNTNCGGCGMSVGLSMLGRVLVERNEKATLTIPACCGIVAAGAFPTTSFGSPVVATTFAASPAVASGIAAIRDLNEEGGQVISWAGDGGTYDIGFATLSAAAERNDDILCICYDNEIYGNTGGQRSSATPPGARTSTTPEGKREDKKDIMAIMAAHRVPYAASLSIAHPDDFARKVNTAMDLRGLRFLLMHSPCPTGWKSEPSESIQLVRLAVESGLFPVYEVWDGREYRINVRPEWTDPSEYFSRQRRFRDDEVDLDETRRVCRERFTRLGRLEEAFPRGG
ncbi:MAG: thiamine pyrophosphate-dependent enzyme [Gemmatimonadota bacterium]|jgi:pyruvate ferredoxin oxidoreductase beta subunit/2-oxoisovalerate ferredoxin oxidoreductase beta subunit